MDYFFDFDSDLRAPQSHKNIDLLPYQNLLLYIIADAINSYKDRGDKEDLHWLLSDTTQSPGSLHWITELLDINLQSFRYKLRKHLNPIIKSKRVTLAPQKLPPPENSMPKNLVACREVGWGRG